MPLTPGSRLGGYEILGPLGAGGMGEVYLARDLRLERDAAIKVLPAEVATDARRLQRFEKEARAASALNHSNIVTIYEIGSDGPVTYIAMERVEGKTLREVLFGGAIPIKKLLPIAAQIADGLARAHEAGIVHRDLKPENLMVTKDGLVKILDFGLAKRTDPGSGSDEGSHIPTETGTSPGVVLGTVGYMSPEQAAGQPVDFRSDQFAFGSILYEMATGKRAFQKGTAVDTLSAILHEDPKPVAESNPEAPAPLRWTVERCLAKAPEDRYVSTRDLARELATVRDHLSEASLSGAALTDAPLRRSSRARAVVIALAMLAAILVGVFGAMPVWKARFSVQPKLRQLTFRGIASGAAKFAPDGQIVYTAGDGELLSARPGTREPRSLGLPQANVTSISSAGDLAILIGKTLATIPLAGGGAPRELMEDVISAAWAPDGKRLAVILEPEGKGRLEFPIGRVLYQTRGVRIGSCSFSPGGDLIAFDERKAYLAGASNGHEVLVVDLSGRTRSITTVPYEFGWSPKGDEIWFNEVRDGTTEIRAVSLSGRKRFVASFAGDYTLDDISRDGRVLLERQTQESEIVGKFAGETAERDLSWLDGSAPADLSADGKTLLFTEIYLGGGPGQSVYKRKTDGTPAVRLGEGVALALSPDGQWALSRPEGAASQVTLLPMGPGQSRTVSLGSIQIVGSGRSFFFPDGKRILFEGFEPERRPRLYVLEIESGKVRPITPEGIPFWARFALSPDGKSVFCPGVDGKYYLFDVEGGPARPMPGTSKDFGALRWSADGRSVFVGSGTIVSFKVYRLDVSSGRQELWKEFSASAVSHAGSIDVIPTPDGNSYVYGSTKWSGDLFVAEGVR